MDFKQLIIPIALVLGWNAMAQEVRVRSNTFQTQVVKKVEVGYALYHPSSKKEAKPLLVFLHGSGEKGTDIQKVIAFGPYAYAQENNLDAYVLAPQCREDEHWEPESLHQLVQKVIKENNIDPRRVYLTGLSMGAWGAWNLAFAHPETFAALVPIAGFVDRIPLVESCKIRTIPTRIFHGLLDDVVPPDNSFEIYKKLKGCHPDIELTLFDDANHDSWSRVYNDHAIYQWMFQQKQTPNHE